MCDTVAYEEIVCKRLCECRRVVYDNAVRVTEVCVYWETLDLDVVLSKWSMVGTKKMEAWQDQERT